jgi:hypothetical protein
MEQSEIKNKKVQGGCYCGRIAYQIQLPVKWCAHCHCSQCRHTQGAPVVTWFGVEKINFEYLKGEQDVAWFDSSDKAQRGHCIHCGTPLFFLGEKWADEVHITRESTQQDILQKPQVHVFYDRHVDYVHLKDNLDKYGGPDGFTALADEE